MLCDKKETWKYFVVVWTSGQADASDVNTFCTAKQGYQMGILCVLFVFFIV